MERKKISFLLPFSLEDGCQINFGTLGSDCHHHLLIRFGDKIGSCGVGGLENLDGVEEFLFGRIIFKLYAKSAPQDIRVFSGEIWKLRGASEVTDKE